jgi:hypothetical protein
MPFTPTERIELAKIPHRFGSQLLDLEKDEMMFFEEINNLRQLRSYLIISPPKPNRIIETAVLVFLLGEKFNLKEIITEIFEFLAPSFRILIDFSFLLEKLETEDEEARFRYSWPQMSTSLPLDVSMIKDEISMEKFLNELPNASAIPDLVSRAHANQSQYQSSGYQLRKLLTCNIYLTKLE